MNKTRSRAGLQPNGNVQEMGMEVVSVAIYRRRTEHLLRLVHSDYHACVGSDELESWHGVTQRIMKVLVETECKRAKLDDRELRDTALDRAREYLAKAEARIQAAKTNSPKPGDHLQNITFINHGNRMK